ncbi:hypothetical protein BV25DRAFT_1832407, partial [Artomyces pyxidatus]
MSNDEHETGTTMTSPAGTNNATSLSPIATLPIELLLAIFRYLPPPPFSLIHVCSLWRQIAWNDKVL